MIANETTSSLVPRADFSLHRDIYNEIDYVSTRIERLERAVKALDRALTFGRYVIPFWHSPVSRIAHASRLAYPERTPLYGDWIGFLPQVWWSKTGE